MARTGWSSSKTQYPVCLLLQFHSQKVQFLCFIFLNKNEISLDQLISVLLKSSLRSQNELKSEELEANGWALVQRQVLHLFRSLSTIAFMSDWDHALNETNILLICSLYSCSHSYVKYIAFCCVVCNDSPITFPFDGKGRWPSHWYAIQYTCTSITQRSDTYYWILSLTESNTNTTNR